MAAASTAPSPSPVHRRPAARGVPCESPHFGLPCRAPPERMCVCGIRPQGRTCAPMQAEHETLSTSDEGLTTLGELIRTYLDDYAVRGLRSLNTARGRVQHLAAFFGRVTPAASITTAQIRQYQRARRAAGAALLQHEPLRRSDPMKADLSDRCCRTPVDRARSSDSRRCTRAASQSAARLASGLADRLR